ncbi:hypothetical protein BOW52_07780 [Solemya elarraichensis gill symbiont]|uniref:Uncharacterized protein n=1 Tax=Solemya elarraichensis gill symbiont TaxID=1918949 RepID=A0A1T2L1N1_9GAMM|nr:hypothetical protein BOW52_07780 [Solemya elarraichensis gill symbiont]
MLSPRDSLDELIREAKFETRTSRKWLATASVSQEEINLNHKDIVGVTAIGREGIGTTKVQLWSRSDQKERRAIIQSEVRRLEEGNGSTGSMDYVEYNRQGADLGKYLEV